MTGDTNRPETALDDLIAEQAMDNHVPSRDDDATRYRAILAYGRRPRRAWCRRCGGYNSHHPLCDEGE